jgi:putative tryptophan/tyrosine transport system substrate-binding protein
MYRAPKFVMLSVILGPGMKPTKRREFIALVGGADTWPFGVRAQQLGMPVIGFLSSTSPEVYTVRLRAFGQGLKEEGYIEGQNVAVEYRWAGDHDDRLP